MDVVVAEVVDKEVNKVIMDVVVVDKVVEEVNKKLFKEYNVFFFILQS